MRHHTFRRTIAQTVTAVATITVCILMPGATLLHAAETEEALLSSTAQQLLDQDFGAARESIKRAAAANRSSKTKKLQESVIAVAAISECLIAPFRDRVGQEVRVTFPQGAELVRITGVDEEGRIKAETLLKVDARVVGTTPRNFVISDLDAGERFKLLGNDAAPERDIMRGLLAWEAGRADAAKNFFAKSKNDLGKLLIVRVDQVIKDRYTAATREQKADQEADAARAYEVILKTAGVESMRKDTDKMVLAVRRRRFSEAEVTQIRREISRLRGELAKTKVAEECQRVVECFALVRPGYPLEVDQATLDKAVAKLKKDNPKEVIIPHLEVKNGNVSMTFENHPALSDISALAGLPITSLRFHSCKSLSDLSPLKGMPLQSLTLSWCRKIADLSPLKGMQLRELNVIGNRMCPMEVVDLSPLAGMPLEVLSLVHLPVTDLGPLKGMPLRRLNLGESSVEDVRPLKGMPLEWLRVTGRVKDLSPVNSIKGLEIVR